MVGLRLRIVSLLVLVTVHGERTMRIPPYITTQPTEILKLTSNSDEQSETGLKIMPLATSAFAVEFQNSTIRTTLKIPCRAEAFPNSIKYLWFKLNATTNQWLALSSSAHYNWSTLENGDRTDAGMLTIQPFGEVADAGAYMCRAITNHSVAVSKILNLTAASFPNEGVQASVTTRTVPAGAYTKLDVPQTTTTPVTNASWIRSTSKEIRSDSGKELTLNRTQMDEKGELHIGYVDNSLLQVMGGTGTSNYNFYHFKYMSLRYGITDLSIYQLSVTGNVPQTKSCKLKYQTPSLSLVHGQSSRIVCVYEGSPSITVSYFKHDASGKPQQLTTQAVADGNLEQALLHTGLYGNTYMIGAAQTTDTGTYSCSATFASDGQNVCEGTAVPINVTVDLEPTFVSQANLVTYVVEGQSVTLQWRIKGSPKPTIDYSLSGLIPYTNNTNHFQSSEQLLFDPVDGYPVYLHTFTLFNTIKPTDSRCVQVYATNQYYVAVSSIALAVISPITFPATMNDVLDLKPYSIAYFVCTAYAYDASVATITWTRYFDNVKHPVEDTGPGGQYRIATNNVSDPSNLSVLTQTLTVDTSRGGSLEGSLGQYSCNVSNGFTWNVTTAQLSFVEVSVAAPCYTSLNVFFCLIVMLAVFRLISDLCNTEPVEKQVSTTRRSLGFRTEEESV